MVPFWGGIMLVYRLVDNFPLKDNPRKRKETRLWLQMVLNLYTQKAANMIL